jgi:hypothetical protein
MTISASLIAATLLGSALPAQAQEKKESDPPVYKVEFNIHDGIAGKPQPSQHYSVLIEESRKAVFQATSRVPVDRGSPPYIDVGVNLDFAIHVSDGKVTLQGSVEMSKVTGQVCTGMCEPIVAQRRVEFHTAVALGTPTVLADDRAAVAIVGPFQRADAAAAGTANQSLPTAPTQRIEAVVTKVN